MKSAKVLLGCGFLLAGFSLTSHAAIIDFEFTTSPGAGINIGSDTVGAGASSIVTSVFEITNSTSVVWTGFSLTTDLGDDLGGFVRNSYSGPLTAVESPVLPAPGWEREAFATLTLENLTVGIGDLLKFSVDVYCGEFDCGGFTGGPEKKSFNFFALPSPTAPATGGDTSTGISEPPLVLLFGVGIALLYSFSRKNAKRIAA